MVWNFYPENEFYHLSVSGTLTWSEQEADIEITVKGADPQFPLRIYGVQAEERYYLGLMIPQKDRMYLKIKRPCPEFSQLFLCIGRAEEEYVPVAVGKKPDISEPQIVIDDAAKQKGEGNQWESLFWEKQTEAESQTDSQKFLFAHPSTRANVKFYGHYCKAKWEGNVLYAFPSSFGPHPLPHLAKFACWYDIDLSCGHRGYFIIGLHDSDFFLPEILDKENQNVI